MTSPPGVPQSSLWMLLHVHTHTHTVIFNSCVHVKGAVSRSNAALYLDDSSAASDVFLRQLMAASQENDLTLMFMFKLANSKK